MSDPKVVLILTGCISPNVTDALAVRDADSRKEMYVYAIRWYLEHTHYNIVFGENSGTSVMDLIPEVYHDRFEELSYYSAPTIPNRSRGYKEMEILEYVRDHSQSVQGADLLVKITGRLVLLNIRTLVNYLLTRLPPSGLVSSMLYSNHQGSDCRFIFFTPQFLPCLLRQKEKITEEVTFEAIMEDAITVAQSLGMSFIYPCRLYRVHGIAMGGSDGKPFVYDRPYWWYLRYNAGYQLMRLRKAIGYYCLVFPHLGNGKY